MRRYQLFQLFVASQSSNPITQTNHNHKSSLFVPVGHSFSLACRMKEVRDKKFTNIRGTTTNDRCRGNSIASDVVKIVPQGKCKIIITSSLYSTRLQELPETL